MAAKPVLSQTAASSYSLFVRDQIDPALELAIAFFEAHAPDAP